MYQRSLSQCAGASVTRRARAPPRTHGAVSRFPQQDAVLKPRRSSSSSLRVTSSPRPRTRLCSYMRKPRAFRSIGTGGRLQTSGASDCFLLGTHSRTPRPLLSLPLDSRRVRGKDSSFISPVQTSDANAPVGSRSPRAQRKIERRVWPSQSCSGGPYHPKMGEGRRHQRWTHRDAQRKTCCV